VVLAPMILASAAQSAQLSWVTTPNASTVASLVRDFAGASVLIPVLAVLVVAGCVTGAGLRRRAGLNLAVVALPWLVLPPVVLITVSLADPVFVERYVIFCLPALSMLAAAGLVDLVRRVRAAVPDRRWLGASLGVVITVVLVAGVFGAQLRVREPGSRPDNLRAVARVIARHERPGDAIVYLPWNTAIVGVAYPAPFAGLADAELGVSPDASASLRGVQAPAGVVARRLRGAGRIWVVRWAVPPAGQANLSPTDRYVVRLTGRLRPIRRWRIGSVILSLYTAIPGTS